MKSKRYFLFCHSRDERSLFHLGQTIVRQMDRFSDIGFGFKISAVKLFLCGGISPM